MRDMRDMRGYAITFAAVLATGPDGLMVYRSNYTITDPANELVESIHGSVEHRIKNDALDEAQVLSERHLSSLAEHGVPQHDHKS
jgi:hypothetical protein